jgi:hypothetical protein
MIWEVCVVGVVGVPGIEVDVAVPGVVVVDDELVVVELAAVVDVVDVGSRGNAAGTGVVVVVVLGAVVLVVDVLDSTVVLVEVLVGRLDVVVPGLAVVVVVPWLAVVVVVPGLAVVVVVPGLAVVVVEPGVDVVVGAGAVVVVLAGAVVVVLAGAVVVDAGVVVVLAGAVVVVLAGAVVVVVGGVVAHVGVTKASVSRVTAPVAASTRPCTVTAVATVTDVFARMEPTNTDDVPSVAELPTCQNTLHSCAPLMRLTVLLDAVMSAESVWKMKTDVGSFAPSSTSGPERASAPLFGPAYTPPCRTWFVRSAGVVASIERPAAST